MIRKEDSLAEIIDKAPVALEVFKNLNIDFCCGGDDSLLKAAKEKNLTPDYVIEQINKESENYSQKDENTVIELEDFGKLNVHEMIKSIEESHHVIERELLFEIDPLINKILLVHYDNHGEELFEIHDLFGKLKTELEGHFVREEKVVFPIMLENSNPDEETIKKIESLEEDHEAAGDIIKKLQEITNNFTTPEDGCRTYQLTFSKLNELVEDIFMHIYKENSVLFKKYASQN